MYDYMKALQRQFETKPHELYACPMKSTELTKSSLPGW